MKIYNDSNQYFVKHKRTHIFTVKKNYNDNVKGKHAEYAQPLVLKTEGKSTGSTN